MNGNMYLLSREAQLKREASMTEADRWRQANPGYRRRRRQLPQLGPLFARIAVRVHVLLARRDKPQMECC